MKFPNYVATIFLTSGIFMSCEIEIEFIEPVRANDSLLILVPLNPTEQKLRGRWHLSSMVTRDTAYNDIPRYNVNTLNFTEFARPGQTSPILVDEMKLYLKATPDSAIGLIANETYEAPDFSTLIIQYTGGTPQVIDTTIRFQITRLEAYNLNLKDSLTGKQWKFVR